MDIAEETFEVRHARVVVFVVPAICHRLNNAVAVSSGMVELALLGPSSDSLSENLTLAFEQSSKAAGQIKRLGSFAHLTEDALVSEDGARSVEDAAELLHPICQVTRTRFEHRPTDRVFPVVTDRKRLMQLVIVLACSSLLPNRAGAHDGRTFIESMRLSIGSHQFGAVIRLTMKGCDALEVESTAELLTEAVGAIDARLFTRTIGETTSYRLCLVAVPN